MFAASSIAVVSPALHHGEVAGSEVAVQVVDVGPDFEALDLWQRLGIDTWPGDDDHAKVRHALLGAGEGSDHPPQQVASHARAPDSHDADLLVVPVAQLGTQRGAVAVLRWLARDVVEDHEVGDEDLVHAAPGVEPVQVVLGRLGLDVARLIGEVLAGGVDALTLALDGATRGAPALRPG